jgi:HK97 gp10 family phage protein
MAQPAIKVEGLTELRRKLRQLGDKDLKKQLRDTNKSLAQKIIDAALPNVPVRTGRLKATVKAAGNEKGAIGKAGTPARVPYAAAIHWGWRRRGIRANPFLTDAAARVEGHVVEEYEKDLQALLDRVTRGR